MSTMDPRVPQKPSVFEREHRVRLFHMLDKLLSMPKGSWMGGYENGEEFFSLEEMLKFDLGRLSLGGAEPEERLQKFICNEPDDNLLKMISLIPAAVENAGQEVLRRSRYALVDREKPEKMIEALNWWLGESQSPARFVDGVLRPDGIVDETPKALRNLPTKENLIEDVKTTLKENKIISLVFIDLDNFKAVNDAFGHPEGTKCLERVAEIIGSIATGKGRLYRYGGDEFAVLLKNFSTDEAVATAERIRLNIDIANLGGTVRVTASIGVASSEQGDSGPEELLDMADKAAYASKNSGKNRVSRWKL